MKTTMNTFSRLVLALIICSTILFGGCASNQKMEQVKVPETPRYINAPSRVVEAAQTNNGSLYVAGSRHAQINDFRAYDINDLVQIQVVESTTATNRAGLSSERSNSTNRSLSALLGLQDRILPRSVDPTNILNTDTDDEFESTGSNTRSESISTRLTARVIDRLPNGNLVIQAVREIIVSGERQVMVVSGMIRPVDIDDTNAVLSSKIADLQIQYGGTGTITQNMRRGWFSNFLSYIWPM